MKGPLYGMLGQSRGILEVLDDARLMSETDCNVLLTGERGVGKELLAQFIHEHSTRRQRKMLSLNCACAPESQLESELFGSGERVGLFERAHRSTLLLEDVDALGPRLQAALLRVLENGEIQRVGSERRQTVAVRIISATTCDLLQSAADHAFRVDLYYRLNVGHLQVPALRDRCEDVSFLMRHYLKILSEEFGLPPCELHPLALRKLEIHGWPRNIRELRDLAELFALRHAGTVVTVDQLPHTILAPRSATSRIGAEPVAAAIVDSMATACYERITQGAGSFWTVVYEPFLAGTLADDTVRAVVSRGLLQTGGSYKGLTALFNLPPTDHARFQDVLRQHHWHRRPHPVRIATDDAMRVSPAPRRSAALPARPVARRLRFGRLS